MAREPERSRPLHNFTLPRLKWGNQRFLRCMKVDNAKTDDDRRFFGLGAESDGSNRSRAAAETIRRRSSSNVSESFKKSSPLKPIGGGDNNGIEAVREKLMFDLRVAADKMKDSILEEKELEESNSAARPWNLRTRRAACKAPNESGGGGGGGDGGGGGKGSNLRSEERQQRNNCNSSPLRPESPMATAKSSRLRGLAAAASAMTTTQQSVEGRDNEQRAKFSISLSRQEVERDFLAMARIRPPRRPKKRPKIVQRQVDAIFPGLWLAEVTSDIYKVPDDPEPGKG